MERMRVEMKKTIAALLAALLLLGLAACGDNNSQPSGSASGGTPSSDAGSPSAGGSEGKYLNVMLSTNVMSLDTNLATDGDSFEVIADCIDGLTQMDA